MKSMIKRWADRIGLSYASFLARYEHSAQQFLPVNERPVEYRFVFQHLTHACPRSVLDVGTGMTALPHLMRSCGYLVTAIDNIRAYWPSGMTNRHYHVIDDDIVHTKLTMTFDFITCISVLEHIPDHREAMRSMMKLLNPGGHLVVTFPYHETEYVRNVYDLAGSRVQNKPAFTTQAFSRAEVRTWLEDGAGELIDQEYWQFFTGDHWTCGDRVCPPVKVNSSEKHQISCLAIRKRPST